MHDRKPDLNETQKRGFTTMREAQLYLSMVTVSKSKGEYIDPNASRMPVKMFADSWLRSKRPPMTKPSYYMTLERAWKNHVAPVWGEREIWSIRRSEVQDWVPELATEKSRTVVLRALGVLAGILDAAIVAWRPTRPETSAISLEPVPASVGYTSRMIRWRRWRRVRRIRRWS